MISKQCWPVRPSLGKLGRFIVGLGFAVSLLSLAAQGDRKLFPPGVFYPDNPKLDSFVAKWYSEQLIALEEPPLFEAKQYLAEESYRFLWLRTFHKPIAIRVVIYPTGRGEVITKIADGAGGYKPGKLIVNKSEALPPEAVNKLRDTIRSHGYWELPVHGSDQTGRDGAQWVIEGFVESGKYHVVDRWSPRNGPVRELGLYFLRDLAKLELNQDEIY